MRSNVKGGMQAFKQALLEDIRRVASTFVGDNGNSVVMGQVRQSLFGVIQAHTLASGVDPVLLSVEPVVEADLLDPHSLRVSLKIKGLLADQFRTASFIDSSAAVPFEPDPSLLRVSADPRDWLGPPKETPADWDDWLFPPGSKVLS